ncbi:MAG: OsmC family protein [Pseudomonadota bacterium]
MSEHIATIEWSAGEGDVAANTYTRAHSWHFDGGLTVPGSASPSVVPEPYSDPKAVDPEEAFVAALSSCHMLWFLDLARRAGFTAARYIDAAKGHMVNDAGTVWISKVELHPTVTWTGEAPDAQKLEELHHAAHQACFLANSVKTEVTTVL